MKRYFKKAQPSRSDGVSLPLCVLSLSDEGRRPNNNNNKKKRKEKEKTSIYIPPRSSIWSPKKLRLSRSLRKEKTKNCKWSCDIFKDANDRKTELVRRHKHFPAAEDHSFCFLYILCK